MRSISTPACLLSLMISSQTVFADAMSGSQLLEFCDKGDRASNRSDVKPGEFGWYAGLCMGYAAGVSDALSEGGSVAGFHACYPKAVTVDQITSVVRKWLRDHPEALHSGASSLVAAAMQGAFPCQAE